MPHATRCLLVLLGLTACEPETPAPASDDPPTEPPAGEVPTTPQSCSDDGAPAAAGIAGPFTTFHVDPFLQMNETDSIWVVWEVERDTEVSGQVEWGCTDALPHTVEATRREGREGTWIFEAQITGLEPWTSYTYRVNVDGQRSRPRTFQTLAPRDWEAPQTFAAMSDMQPGGPGAVQQKWVEVANDGLLAFLESEGRSADELEAVILPGDLVSNGGVYGQWAAGFFSGVGDLLGSAPLWAVPGNHEYDGLDTFFYHYFMLPENGSPELPEHWYAKDFGNVRLFGLNSNAVYASALQLTWLREQLEETCTDPQVDFVFTQLHHPHRSELWLAGESSWSTSVSDLLGAFATDCGKPVVQMFGHTHAYNRGANRDHRHVYMNVATASGDIDYFGEYASADYTEYSVARDEYGFVMIDAQAGDNPELMVQHVSRGDLYDTLDNVVRDAFTLRKNNTVPEKPAPAPMTEPVNAACAALARGTFVDADGDAFGASRVQVAQDCSDFTTPVADVWWQAENIWDDVNTHAAMDLAFPIVTRPLDAEVSYCYRVKVRDEHLGWSDWSDGMAFTTAASALGDNLLVNGDAEDGLTGWTGDIESVASKDCGGAPSYAGERLFVVGGLCKNEMPEGTATQDVDLTAFATEIDAGGMNFSLEGFLRDWNGADIASMSYTFLDSGGSVLAESTRVSSTDAAWTRYAVTAEAPQGTRAARILLEGTRNAGTDNDSYFDNLHFGHLEGDVPTCPDVKVLQSGR